MLESNNVEEESNNVLESNNVEEESKNVYK